MSGLSLGQQMILYGFCVPMLAGALYDIATFRIPNALTATLALLFPAAALGSGAAVEWWSHLAAGLGMFFAGALLFRMGWLGGGDVKLLAAGALWLGHGHLLPFVVIVGVLGGALTMLLLVIRQPYVQAVVGSLVGLPRVLDSKAGVPYGVAIAAGGLVMARHLPLLG